MSDFELVPTSSPGVVGTYVVKCWKCDSRFDAAASPWCSCDSKLRTLKCLGCASCFCLAPFPYKQKFWTDAPKTVREQSQRFRLPSPPPPIAPDPELTAQPATSSRRPHVLIVDDEEPIRSLAACYVEQLGYEVTTISNPEEAILFTESGSFDVVLTDALMPNMDGRELCRRLKAVHGDRLKVVLMTSLYTARHFRTEARHVFKVDEHLAKPLRYTELRDALERVAPLGLPS
jgi:CheY-like chemotaxis protein